MQVDRMQPIGDATCTGQVRELASHAGGASEMWNRARGKAREPTINTAIGEW